jgi:preprotein translocase subunit SecG
VWYVGTITYYDDGIYTVRWDGTDGETERFSAGFTLKQMVANAEQAAAAIAASSETTPAPSRATAGPTGATESPTGATVAPTRATTSPPTTVPFDNAKTELWPLGTAVAEYEDGQWWFGKIKGYNGKGYFIEWDDNEDEEIRDLDLVNQMVADADSLAAANIPTKHEETTKKEGKYPVGTPVQYVSEEDGSTRMGVVESYYRGNYGIRWTDGGVSTFVEGPTMDEIVSATSYNQTSSDGGRKGVGKAFTTVVVLLLVIFTGIYVGLVLYKKKQLKESAEKNANLEEPREDNIVSYRDEPADDTPKIV